MSKAATLAVSFTIQGDGVNTAWAPAYPIASASSPGGSTPAPLTSGVNSFAVPAGAIGFVFVPAALSQVQKSLKFNSGDTGGPIATAVPSPYDWDGASVPPTNIYITAAAAETGGTLYWV